MKVIGFYAIHDCNIAVSVDGEIKVALELERFTGTRYFLSPRSRKAFISVWTKAIRLVTDFTGIQHFDVCVSQLAGRAQLKIMKTLIQADKWVEVEHHICHGASSFYDSPFRSALIISSDGGGDTSDFEVFSATRENGLKSIRRHHYCFGKLYEQISSLLPEVTGPNFFGQDDPDLLPETPQTGNMADVEIDLPRGIALAGKAMGYSALGKPRKEWSDCMKVVYSTPLRHPCQVFGIIHRELSWEDFPVEDKCRARDLAATSQYWFSKQHCDIIGRELKEYLDNPDNPPIDGIVITGGCGLNVCMNQVAVEKFGLPVYVSCAAGDPGIGIGACWLIEPPKKFTQLMYIGLPLFDKDLIDSTAMKRGARKVTVSEVADLLMEHHIVGVVRGRSEFGPRALGHRSLLAYPDKPEQLVKINKLKRRKFYRPACPSVTEESALKLFKGRLDSDRFVSHEKWMDLYDRDDRFSKAAPPNKATSQFPDSTKPDNFLPRSPYMSFAPTIKEEYRKMFPAICHFDNTARLQTVSKESESWFYALLQEIGKRNGGYEVLINTSFNIKGKPILNELSAALHIMDSESEGLLSYVVCEDWLFTRKK